MNALAIIYMLNTLFTAVALWEFLPRLQAPTATVTGSTKS